MEFVDGLSNMFGARGPRSFDALLKFTDLSPSTQRHMQKVCVVNRAPVHPHHPRSSGTPGNQHGQC